MANDAKLGLVLGVSIVLLVALVFFRADAQGSRTPSDQARPTTPLHKDGVPASPIQPSRS